MKTWARFCDIISLNLKNKNLVEGVSTRFFLNEDDTHKLLGQTLCVVPPQLDFPRNLTVKDTQLKSPDKQQLCLSFKEDVELRDLVGKSLLIEKDFADKNFKSSINSADLELVEKTLFDKDLGEIGKVVGIGGDVQKHLIVEKGSKMVYVPYVNEIIVEIDEDRITAELPSGLLDINEA